jgi:hypothetical protein
MIRNSHANIGTQKPFLQPFIFADVTKKKWVTHLRSGALGSGFGHRSMGEKGNTRLL